MITNVRALVQIGRGPLATAYRCPYCGHCVTIRKGTLATRGAGRGAGLANGSRAHSAVTNHIKAVHGDKLAAN